MSVPRQLLRKHTHLVIHGGGHITLKHSCLKHFYDLSRFPGARKLGAARGGVGSEPLMKSQPDGGWAGPSQRLRQSQVWCLGWQEASSWELLGHLLTSLWSLHTVSLAWWLRVVGILPQQLRTPKREGHGDTVTFSNHRSCCTVLIRSRSPRLAHIQGQGD